ncbi:MAG: iron donor protein CyaY [Pseudomonadales bacterium]
MPMMEEAAWHKLIDELFAQVEDAIDELELDLDVESAGGILTLRFEGGSADGSKSGSVVILSRQPAARELWVAARSGGFHLRQTDDGWHCGATGEDLPALLNRVVSEQLGSQVALLPD